MHKNYRHSYFYNGKSDIVFCFFFLKSPNIRKKQSQNGHLSQFSDKSDEKVVREKTYRLKLDKNGWLFQFFSKSIKFSRENFQNKYFNRLFRESNKSVSLEIATRMGWNTSYK